MKEKCVTEMGVYGIKVCARIFNPAGGTARLIIMNSSIQNGRFSAIRIGSDSCQSEVF